MFIFILQCENIFVKRFFVRERRFVKNDGGEINAIYNMKIV